MSDVYHVGPVFLDDEKVQQFELHGLIDDFGSFVSWIEDHNIPYYMFDPITMDYVEPEDASNIAPNGHLWGVFIRNTEDSLYVKMVWC